MFSERFSVTLEPPSAPPRNEAFVVCPITLGACSAQVEAISNIYRLAYEEARDLHKPSRWSPLYQACLN